MKKVTLLLLIVLAIGAQAAFPSNSGLVLTDIDGGTWDIDQLLSEGKHIIVVTAGSG